jgi:peptide-methionine (R)-S-oxide reductase
MICSPRFLQFLVLFLSKSTFVSSFVSMFTTPPPRAGTNERTFPLSSSSLSALDPILDPISWAVLNWGATEPRFTSLYNYNKKPGTYNCKRCSSLLYDSSKKYDSKSGWPSFTEGCNVRKMPRDYTGRFEVRCGNCDGHLGHVFPDGPTSEEGGTGWRHCVNGAALTFEESVDSVDSVGSVDSIGSVGSVDSEGSDNNSDNNSDNYNEQ